MAIIALPSINKLPVISPCGAISGLRSRKSVVLPEPEAPQTSISSPSFTESETSSNASVPLPGYLNVRFLILSISIGVPPGIHIIREISL